MHIKNLLPYCALLALTIVATQVHAADINTQELLRQQERQQLLREQQEIKPDVRDEMDALKQVPLKASIEIPDNETPCFAINSIALVGDNAAKFQFALDEVLSHNLTSASETEAKPILGRCLGAQGINAVMNRVQNAIIASGYVTTRVLAAPQDLKAGLLQLTIITGHVSAIRFTPDSSKRISMWNAAPISAGDILNLRDIEQTLENFKRILAGGDATVNLINDYTHTANGALQANGNLSLSTAGNILNQSAIMAGQALTIHAANIDNTVSGELSGLNTYIDTTGGTGTAIGAVTNRGLIDGGDTFIHTGTLNNLGTGTIFGNHVAIAADTLNNLDETVNGITTSAVIAACNRMDIGAKTINNRNSALLFSGGDMAIGGALDANHQATVAAGTPQTVVLNNISASIEALGNLSLNVATLNNQRTDFAITRALSTTLPDDLALLQYNPALQFFWPYDEVSPLFWRNSVRDRYLNSINTLLGGTLDSSYRSQLVALVDAQPRSVYQDSINIWNLLINTISIDHPEYITTMAQSLSSQRFPLTNYNQLCRDTECDYIAYIDNNPLLNRAEFSKELLLR